MHDKIIPEVNGMNGAPRVEESVEETTKFSDNFSGSGAGKALGTLIELLTGRERACVSIGSSLR
jgi:hypothetical protein